MRKYIRQISQFTAWLMASLLISGIVCPTRSLAQDGRKLTTPNDVWRVSYTITIKGHGTEQPELGSDGPVIKWVVNRTYTGTGKLDFGKNPWYTIKSARDDYAKKLKEPNPTFSEAMFTQTLINDSIEKTYDPTCDEYEITTETWKANAENGNPYEHASLTINNSDLTHNAKFPVKISYAYRSLLDDVIKGYQGKREELGYLIYQKKVVHYPENKVELGKPEYQKDAKNLEVPNITDWLAGGKLDRTNKALSQEKPLYFFADSGEITVNETVLAGVDTSGKVKIQITYSLTLEH